MSPYEQGQFAYRHGVHISQSHYRTDEGFTTQADLDDWDEGWYAAKREKEDNLIFAKDILDMEQNNPYDED